MKFHYLHCCLAIIFTSCLQEESLPDLCVVDFSQEYAYRPVWKVVFPPEAGEELDPCTRPLPDIEGYYQILSDEICPLEQHFLKILELDPGLSDPVGWQLDATQLDLSVIQYIGAIVNGRKYVYLNGFYLDPELSLDDDFPYWRDRFVLFCDGGGWGALFDPGTEQFSDLAFEHR